MSGDRPNSPLSPTRSIARLTSQMAQLTRSTPDYRKQAFSQVGNHSSWPTPPTELDHDFAQAEDMDETMDKSMRILPALKEDGIKQQALFGDSALHSPPASPKQGWTDRLPPIQSSTRQNTPLPAINDAQLFSEPSTFEAQSPLFSQATVKAEDRTDSLSPAGRQASPAAVAKPQPVEPIVHPSFKGILSIFPQFQGADRAFFRHYRRACYEELKSIPGWRPVNGRRLSQLPVLTAPPASLQRSFRVVKPKQRETTTPKRPVVPKAKLPSDSTAVSPPVVAKPRPVKNTVPAMKRERQAAAAEAQAVRKRAPPSKPTIVDNWRDITDYSPSTATLDTMTNRLRVHWKGVPNDLSTDPEVKHLHPQEVEIAQELKLPANQYLSNKRRIFEARLKSIRDHKNFTKTAAQQACNIDVNKTSQLFEAYEKVGWFDEANFKQWLV